MCKNKSLYIASRQGLSYIKKSLIYLKAKALAIKIVPLWIKLCKNSLDYINYKVEI